MKSRSLAQEIMMVIRRGQNNASRENGKGNLLQDSHENNFKICKVARMNNRDESLLGNFLTSIP
jgi:hypothetical protein